jgi:hypothetical protein
MMPFNTCCLRSTREKQHSRMESRTHNTQMSSPSTPSVPVVAVDKAPLDAFRPGSPTQVSAADQECIGTLADLVEAVDGAFASTDR